MIKHMTKNFECTYYALYYKKSNSLHSFTPYQALSLNDKVLNLPFSTPKLRMSLC